MSTYSPVSINDPEDFDVAGSGRLPFKRPLRGDARQIPLDANCVDLVVTSPPYWRKRDYKVEGQIGQEPTPELYVAAIGEALAEWKRVLRPSGSVFLNIGDTYQDRSLVGIPSRIERMACEAGWSLRNRIVWVKKGGMPDPARDRLASRHEYVLHLAVNGYFYDLYGYATHDEFGQKGANPGDVWEITPQLQKGKHLAPFPREIAKRAIVLACPKEVCSVCGKPRRRILEATADLDESRPQARRAIELAREKGLTAEHFEAIRATGISDAGKARLVQTGTDKNTERVQQLAKEAKLHLGGYFREFTFAKRRDVGWTSCLCGAEFIPGVVLDPFMGTGTTLDVAYDLGLSSYGVDLKGQTE